MRARLPNGRLHALVNNAGISPKGPGGARLGVLGTDAATWMHVLNVNIVSTALIVRALVEELAAGQGLDRQRDLDRRLARASLRRRRLCGLEGGAGGADARNGA